MHTVSRLVSGSILGRNTKTIVFAVYTKIKHNDSNINSAEVTAVATTIGTLKGTSTPTKTSL